MAFDATKDHKWSSKKLEFEDTSILVEVCSYGDGPKKIGLTRVILDAKGEEKWAKLGRITKEEAEAILPALQEAIKKLSEEAA